MVRALKAARKFLWDGTQGTLRDGNSERYICFCLDAAEEHEIISYAVAEPTRRIIQSRIQSEYSIGAFASLEDWLRSRGVPQVETEDHYRMQAYRKEWLNMLIKEFSEKNPTRSARVR